MHRRGSGELEEGAPMLESAPLPEKRRSTLLTVCPFILGDSSLLISHLFLHCRPRLIC